MLNTQTDGFLFILVSCLIYNTSVIMFSVYPVFDRRQKLRLPVIYLLFNFFFIYIFKTCCYMWYIFAIASITVLFNDSNFSLLSLIIYTMCLILSFKMYSWHVNRYRNHLQIHLKKFCNKTSMFFVSFLSIFNVVSYHYFWFDTTNLKLI